MPLLRADECACIFGDLSRQYCWSVTYLLQAKHAARIQETQNTEGSHRSSSHTNLEITWKWRVLRDMWWRWRHARRSVVWTGHGPSNCPSAALIMTSDLIRIWISGRTIPSGIRHIDTSEPMRSTVILQNNYCKHCFINCSPGKP
jgi:hypothetical protein